jgi:hypothetical protein
MYLCPYNEYVKGFAIGHFEGQLSGLMLKKKINELIKMLDQLYVDGKINKIILNGVCCDGAAENR